MASIFDISTEERSTFDVPPVSDEELEQLLISIQLAQAKVDSVIRSGNFSADLFANLPDELLAIAANPANRNFIENQQFDLAASTGDLSKRLLEDEAASISQGSKIDPQTEALIDQVFESQFQSGQSDIDQALRNTLKIIREEIAPQLGLRPEDTPNLDRAALVAAESLRQTGQLRSQISSASATAKLNFPLQQDALTSQRTFNFANTAESASDFTDRLAQQAFLNRQLLTDQAGNFGINTTLATGASPGTTAVGLGSNRAANAPKTITATSTNFGNTVEGLSGVVSGVGDLLNLEIGGTTIGDRIFS